MDTQKNTCMHTCTDTLSNKSYFFRGLNFKKTLFCVCATETHLIIQALETRK